MAKIECILKRDGGTSVELGRDKYHFAPDGDGRHTCRVVDQHHIASLLAIPEAYRLIDSDSMPIPPDPKQIHADDAQHSANQHSTVHDGDDHESDEKAAAVAEYINVFGTKPNGRWGAERIRKEIEEARNGN